MSECLSGLTGEKDYYNVVKYDISKATQIREFIESHCDLTDLKKDNKDSELRITAQQTILQILINNKDELGIPYLNKQSHQQNLPLFLALIIDKDILNSIQSFDDFTKYLKEYTKNHKDELSYDEYNLNLTDEDIHWCACGHWDMAEHAYTLWTEDGEYAIEVGSSCVLKTHILTKEQINEHKAIKKRKIKERERRIREAEEADQRIILQEQCWHEEYVAADQRRIKEEQEAEERRIKREQMQLAINKLKIDALTDESLRVYLDIPYDERSKYDRSKIEFDKEKKMWYSIEEIIILYPILNDLKMQEGWYKIIPFNLQDKDQIKQLGAKYDPATKSWYSKKLLKGFEKYLV